MFCNFQQVSYLLFGKTRIDGTACDSWRLFTLGLQWCILKTVGTTTWGLFLQVLKIKTKQPQMNTTTTTKTTHNKQPKNLPKTKRQTKKFCIWVLFGCVCLFSHMSLFFFSPCSSICSAISSLLLIWECEVWAGNLASSTLDRAWL